MESGGPQWKQKVGAQAGIQLRQRDSFPFCLTALASADPQMGSRKPTGFTASPNPGQVKSQDLIPPTA
ncbi:unnamed protein product [Rangifer tarandus platyrhynchus]|uniref:Uncharacterized protein n=1 Tax=Rangifer tarandus platyrhynchus TaxID=3082113 RepID=A0AC59YB73_RANTA